MKILVLWTPDGDLYYRGNRRASKLKASEVSADMVLTNWREKFLFEDIERIQQNLANADWQALYDTLLDIGAIKERELLE